VGIDGSQALPSDLVSLIHRFARPGHDFEASMPLAIDAGCGPDRHVRLLQDIGFRAVGIDDDPEMCAVAPQDGVEAL
jgi:SAM-dependent methyltransferase